jgi:alkylation response protein AidB-like acyl-CoA dehydrogenase
MPSSRSVAGTAARSRRYREGVSAPLDELVELLEGVLPPLWWRAVRAGDRAGLEEVRSHTDLGAVIGALGRAGWIVPQWSPRYGGRGVDEETASAAWALLDEMDVPRSPGGAGLVLAAPTIFAHASEATKLRFLPAIAAGTERWCQLFSEPGAGSDLASLACRAVRDGDEWVVNGQKVWTTMGHESEMAMLLARTDPQMPKHKGITYFGVDLRTAGVEIRPLVQMTGEHEFNEVFLTDVRIPDLFRISAVGEGWKATATTLSSERLSQSKLRSRKSILGGKTVDDLLRVVRTRSLSGVEQDRVAQAYVEDRILQWTTRRVRGPAGSMTRIAKAATNQQVQELALSIVGSESVAWAVDNDDGRAYSREFLRTRANSIEGGTSEIQRNIVGERVLGLPRDPDPYVGKPWEEVPRS